MKLKKDFFLDTLYSILFAILIQVDNASLNKENLALVFILRNLILISILVLWLKALSRNKAGVILVTDAPSKNTGILKIGFKMLSQFIGMKLCCFLLIFCSFSLFTDRFEFDALQRYSLQIVTIGFYTLSVLLICMAYLKISINDWRFVLVILGPFFLLFLIYGVFGLSNYQIFSLLPSNIQLISWRQIPNLGDVIMLMLSLMTYVIMIILFFKSIEKLRSGPKYLVLSDERMN